MPSRPIPQLHLPNFTKPRDDRRRALVVGAGMAGLVAARDLAAAGYSVTVIEAKDAAGGCVGVHTVAGLELDSGAESFATRTTAVADLATELGLAKEIVSPNPAGAWVQLPQGPAPLPKTGILGIPADPWAPEVRSALGLAGSLRASLDKQLPASVGTGPDSLSVADLVRARMGNAVLEKLVATVVGGVHSADPAQLEVDMVAPGLRAAVREHGSLSAAVAALRAGREGAKAGSAVGGLRGGMNRLVTALLADLTAHGVTIRLGSQVASVREQPDGRWGVELEQAEAGKAVPAYAAEVLVVATDGPAAVRLLQPELPEVAAYAPAVGPDVSLVTLVVDLPELDTAPRGTGVLVAPQSSDVRAKALTHATAKWNWLGEEEGPGTHVLRLSYGRDAKDAAASDEELRDAALADATVLLGIPVSADDVVGWDVVRWTGALPFAALGARVKVTAFRTLISAQPSLLVLGGWLSGNGLAAVVGDARAQVREFVTRHAAEQGQQAERAQEASRDRPKGLSKERSPEAYPEAGGAVGQNGGAPEPKA
ncbi:MAG: protoporphyrinogen oxidase [Acidobacteria bacterium]|nr:protoporphyrinogen oxidase [Acidobacteriota bacterium]